MLDSGGICQFCGLVMILGAIFLIFKEKVYLDAQTKEPMFVELPTIGRMRTNAPVLGVFVLGLIAVIYPVYSGHTHYLRVQQHVNSSLRPIRVYAVAAEDEVGEGGILGIKIPILNDEHYSPRVLYYFQNKLVALPQNIEISEAKHGVVKLADVSLQDAVTQDAADTKAQPLKVDNSEKPEGFK